MSITCSVSFEIDPLITYLARYIPKLGVAVLFSGAFGEVDVTFQTTEILDNYTVSLYIHCCKKSQTKICANDHTCYYDRSYSSAHWVIGIFGF